MPVSTRFGLWAAVIAVTLASSACGDDKEKNSDDGAGSAMDGSTGASGGADAGLVEIADLDDNVAGSACQTSADCKGKGAACIASTCTGFCENNKNCGAGGTCVQPVAGQIGSCSKLCKTSADCNDGLECREGANLSDIFGDVVSAIADAGFSLDAGLEVKNLPKTCGESLGVVSLPDGVVGKACSGDEACAPGECATNVNIVEPFPAGYCTGKCLKDSECGAGGVCYTDPVSAALKLEGRCLLGCSTSASCRAGQVCRSSMFINAKTYCLPPAPDAGTGTGESSSDAGVSRDN